MNLTRMADLMLRASRSADCQGGPRTIVKFREAGELNAFLDDWTNRVGGDASDVLRPLPLVSGVLAPCSLRDLRPLLPDDWVCEEDARVRLQALPKGTATTRKGIPWGVSRIKAPEAWSRTTGYRVKVGVIDTGVDFLHPDLRYSLGPGINLLQSAALPVDDNGHGTHIAGTIAAANQYAGMIGVAPRSIIYPVKAFDMNGAAYVSDIILGIDWCVQSGVDVVNMSFGMRTRSRSLLGAVERAFQAGVLIVASSGNDGRKSEIDYPAKFAKTIAVGATTRQGGIASFTNRSPHIDIYAPGDRISSSWLRGRHRIMSGTSMATSHVTGAVALLLAYRPGLTPGQIKQVLKRSAKPLKNGKIPRTAGTLDVIRMLELMDR